MRLALVFTLAAALALAQGTAPKPQAADYDVHADTPKAALGAEFMVHSFSGQGTTYIAKDYLVVEVALYPPKGQPIDVGRFALRINGKKQLLTQAQPQMVATSLLHTEWQTGPRLEGGGGLGNTGVILG